MTTKDTQIEKLTIRPARKADFPILVDFLAKLALHVADSPPLTLREEERKHLQDNLADALVNDDKLLIVAELSKSGVVGMGYIHILRSQGLWEQDGDQELQTAVIDDTWVEPAFRQQGIFGAILCKLISFAEDRGLQDLILEYAASNKEAKATWTRLGFETTGVRAAASTATVKKKLAKCP
ncbi:GNAT family N-acetyltransferase [Hydrogenovibrio halophilus]|uniref:GNAT family N-acetyltransferase n=1 Tax=Hydrogenovibrio halophilus TaxID=373391 RepID=UPI00036D09DA|nr:GNAT family N-acetyltransferase [Hydrogenovibrio halophilus]